LLRHELTSTPSSLFSLFFPEIYSGDLPSAAETLARGDGGSRKNSGMPRCYPLFFSVSIFIEIAQCFTDFRAIAPRTIAELGPAGPPVFAEILQALTIPLHSPRTAFNTSYCCLSCERNAAIHAASCRRKLLQKYAIVN
jgi:hypothetical protein